MRFFPFNSKSDGDSGPKTHMTWARASVSQRMSQTRYFLKRQLWIWPIIAVLVLAIGGYVLQGAIESTIKRNVASGLQTVLDLETEMLRNWFRTQQDQAQAIANQGDLRESFAAVLLASSTEDGILPEAVQQLRQQLLPRMSSQSYVGFFTADRNGRILCASQPALEGRQAIPEFNTFLPRVTDGRSVVSVPFPSVVTMKSATGKLRTGEPTMYVAVPIRDDSFHVVGALALQIRPELEFTDILQYGRVGDSGETYAFDRAGVLTSNSRFDEDLILLGLLPDEADARSLLNVHIRDPGGDMTAGFRPRTRRAQRPLTTMAQAAIHGESGIDVEGYRDYRGVPVVGAWTWLPEYEMGVATEVDVAQAFRPIVILQRAFWTLFILLALSSVAIFVFTVIVARLRREAQRAAIDAQQLGQYRLDEKLGAGAMGVVYKGRHAMLQRETAIKLLDVDKVNDASIARFEREVRITCQLNHPNTIAIYDFGRTPEGVFYYAMEYLDGIDLQEMVEHHGPLPEARVIGILKQIAGSLNEAHSLELVHRDIKPANIVLSRRGREPDVVKVLDFGLVRALDQDKESGMTAAGALTGTPLYMSPEAIQSPSSVDGRSDLYAVGAVGFFLLTGTPVFSAESIVELCRMHVDLEPERPSRRLGQTVTPELEQILLDCLCKQRSRRPPSARDLIERLEQCPVAEPWTFEMADRWWDTLRPAAPVTQMTQSEEFSETVIASPVDAPNAPDPRSRHPR